MPRDRLLQRLEQTVPDVIERGDGAVALLPRGTPEVATIVREAREVGALLTPPGGEPREGAVPVQLQRMAEVLAVDDTSHLVHAQAGMTVGAVEAALRPRGLTLGLEDPAPETPLGRWLALGAPGARDHEDDPVDQLVAGMELVLPDGRTLAIRPAPRRAVGPDLLGAVVGGRGRLGIVTAVHVVARRRLPSATLAMLFGAREAAEAARAWIRGRGVRPASAEVVDAPEGAALRLRIEGEDAVREAGVAVCREVGRARGGVEVGAADAPARPRPEPVLESRVVGALADALDPGHVFG